MVCGGQYGGMVNVYTIQQYHEIPFSNQKKKPWHREDYQGLYLLSIPQGHETPFQIDSIISLASV